MLIMGIVATLTVPKFAKTLQTQKVNQAAKRIKADVELAKGQAVASSSQQIVSFDVTDNQYHLPQEKSLDRPGEVYRVRLADYGVEIQSAEFSSDTDADIAFNGFGIPDHSGVIVVKSGTEKRRINIEAETGSVSIQAVSESVAEAEAAP